MSKHLMVDNGDTVNIGEGINFEYEKKNGEVKLYSVIIDEIVSDPSTGSPYFSGMVVNREPNVLRRFNIEGIKFGSKFKI